MEVEEIKEKILNSATELFMRDGCKRVTMDQIASNMHMSKRTLYELFSTKEELLTACTERIAEMFKSHRERLLEEVEEPVLLALYMMRNAVEMNNRYCTLLHDMERYYPEIYSQFFKMNPDSFRNGMLKALKEAKEKKILRENVDLELVSDTMIQYVQSHKGQEHLQRDAYLQQIHSVAFTFLRGLMTAEAVRQFDEQEPRLREIFEKHNSELGQPTNTIE